MPPGGPAPVRELTGLWDAGAAGIGGQGQAAARDAARAPFTPLGQEMFARNKPGNGANAASVAENNDPLNTVGDPSGFPRIVNYELRTIQIVETPGQVLMLFSFNKTWRSIWTDGRQLPSEPDPRWFGYSIGRWEDDYTFVVETNGLDDRTWLDNNGHPHSTALKVTERYRRVNHNTLELTVDRRRPARLHEAVAHAGQIAAEAAAGQHRCDRADLRGVRGAGVPGHHRQPDEALAAFDST